MPLYGRSFTNTDGPGTSYSGVTSGTWETGIYDYKVLPLSDTMVFVDIASEASWSYDTSQRTMISFDTPEITVGKASLIKNEGLGGAMWWEASSDKSGAESLLSAVGLVLEMTAGEH
jgi:chitinase